MRLYVGNLLHVDNLNVYNRIFRTDLNTFEFSIKPMKWTVKKELAIH